MKIFIITIIVSLLFGACAHRRGHYHTVKKYESIKSLASCYQVTPDTIISANKDIGSKPEKGAVLYIPMSIDPEISCYDDVLLYGKKSNREKSSRKTETLQFVWPAKGSLISQFGIYNGIRHEGIRIALKKGSNVYAVADGKVLFASAHGAYGNTVILQHSKDYISIYSHLDLIIAKEGGTMKQGQRVGLSGDTGGTEKPSLHFELREKSKPVDPLKLLPEKQ